VGLLATALGLALANTPVKALAPSVLLLAASALAAGHLIGEIPERQTMIGCAFGILISAVAVHVTRVPTLLALLLSANAGLWSGAVAMTSDQPSPLLALSSVLILIPARWIVARDRGIVLKVLSGWLFAVAVLAAALPLITTAGYEPDHME
jgi:hypothetical protein